MRIALVGKTGVGKSALGNTILGIRKFESKAAAESVTKDSEFGFATNCDRSVKVVDTPGLLDTSKKQVEIKEEVEKAMKMLSPGPMAILIVVSPIRFTAEEKKVIQELKELFNDEAFLNFTILVMVRRNEICDEKGEIMNLHDFIATRAAPELKQLYEKCGNRIVGVDNIASQPEKQKYAMEIFTAIDSLGGGYFNHAYFEVERLKEVLKRRTCDIL